MKKNILFLTLAAIIICSTIFAQPFIVDTNEYKSEHPALAKVNASNYFKLDLHTGDINHIENFILDETSTEILVLAKLSADFVNPFVGAQIAGINVYFYEPVSNVTVFIRETTTGQNIASKVLPNATQGWHQVIYDTPLTLEKKDYYIGYHIPILPSGTYPIGFIKATAESQEAMLLSINQGEFVDKTFSHGALAVQFLLTGSNDMFRDKAYLTKVMMETTYSEYVTLDIPISFCNIGLNDINSIEITYTLSNNEPVQQSFTLNVPTGSTSQTITLNNVSINRNGYFTVAITKVNGVEFSGQSITKPIIVYDPEVFFERKVLLEQYTTERCMWCPQATARIKDAMEEPEFEGKVIRVEHHVGYYTDSYTIPESIDYLRFFGVYSPFAPAMMIDRTKMKKWLVMYVPNFKESIAALFSEALNVLTTITVSIKQENSVDTNRKVNITVSGEEKRGLTPTDDLYVFIFLLENEITTTTQNGSGGIYAHDNLIRSVINGVEGTKITWDENYRFSVTAEATLPDEWNANNMDVVAFVAKNYENHVDNVEVINAEKVKLTINSLTAVDNVYGDAIHAYAENGSIVVDGEYTSINIHSIDGKEFRNSNLPKGVYIVKLENKGQIAVKKVIVK